MLKKNTCRINGWIIFNYVWIKQIRVPHIRIIPGYVGRRLLARHGARCGLHAVAGTGPRESRGVCESCLVLAEEDVPRIPLLVLAEDHVRRVLLEVDNHTAST